MVLVRRALGKKRYGKDGVLGSTAGLVQTSFEERRRSLEFAQTLADAEGISSENE